MPTRDERERIKYLKSLIEMLKEDIDCFGPAGDDLFRLSEYKRELRELQNKIA